MPTTATAMIMTITAKMEAMTVVDDRPACGVLFGTLEETAVYVGNSTCLFKWYKREERPFKFLFAIYTLKCTCVSV